MKMSSLCAVVALGLGIMAAPKADALGVIWSETYQYGNQAGQRNPGGNDVLGNGFVTVSDQSTNRFIDTFNFTSLVYESISEFRLTLTFHEAGPSGCVPILGCLTENWSVRVPGSNSSFTNETSGSNAGQANDYFGQLVDKLSPQTFVISSASMGDAFAEALPINKFIFGFAESTLRADAFDLKSAQLDIVGVIPLPGAVWLLGSVAAAGLIAKRRKNRPQSAA